MKKYFTHITSIFFLVVFMLNGMASLLPLFSIETDKQAIVELLTKTESENSGKEKEEKVPEKELIHHTMDIEFPALFLSGIKKNAGNHSAYWDNIFLNVFTPPPRTSLAYSPICFTI